MLRAKFSFLVVALLLWSAPGKGIEKRSTKVGFSLSWSELVVFVEDQSVTEHQLAKLTQAIGHLESRLKDVDSSMRNLRDFLRLLFSADKVLAVEVYLRHLVESFQDILEGTRILHNTTSQSNETFVESARILKARLEAHRFTVSRDVPGKLAEMHTYLTGASISSKGSSRGFLCDVTATTLTKVSEAGVDTYNFTHDLLVGPIGMMDALGVLQTEVINIYRATTCTPSDIVCLNNVNSSTADLESQRKKLGTCLPPPLEELARRGTVTVGLGPSSDQTVLTAQRALDSLVDVVVEVPSLRPLQNSSRQALTIEQEGRFFRFSLGSTCHVSLHQGKYFGCTASKGPQDALFLIRCDIQGRVQLLDAHTGLPISEGKRPLCEERTLLLSRDAGATWRLREYNLGNDDEGPVQNMRKCRIPVQEISGSSHSVSALLLVILLSLLTLGAALNF